MKIKKCLGLVLFLALTLPAQAITLTDSSQTSEAFAPNDENVKKLSMDMDALLAQQSDFFPQDKQELHHLKAQLNASEKKIKQLHRASVEKSQRLSVLSKKQEALAQQVNDLQEKIKAVSQQATTSQEKLKGVNQPPITSQEKRKEVSQQPTTSLQENFVSKDTLDSELATVKKDLQAVENKIPQPSAEPQKKPFYLPLVVVVVVFFLLIALLFWLYKKLASQQKALLSSVTQKEEALKEQGLSIDTHLLRLLEAQTQRPIAPESKVTQGDWAKETDHQFALKIADEIVRIQKNLALMDPHTKGIKQIAGSIKRIQSNLLANGYELVDMVGKEFNDGMKVVAEFIPSTQVEKGKQIITRVIKPQVNFNGAMIQSAQIEVSVGE